MQQLQQTSRIHLQSRQQNTRTSRKPQHRMPLPQLRKHHQHNAHRRTTLHPQKSHQPNQSTLPNQRHQKNPKRPTSKQQSQTNGGLKHVWKKKNNQ